MHCSVDGIPRGLYIEISRERSMTSGEISYDSFIRMFFREVSDENDGNQTDSLASQFTVQRDNDVGRIAISITK